MNKSSKLIVILFFTAVLCVGLFVYKDYGISWDELVSRNNGLLTYKYVFEGNDEILTYQDRYYGTAFELLLILLEKPFNFDDPRELFLFRHLATFFLFWISAIFFFLLCRDRFGDWKMGLLGSTFLFLSPRIFAHSFFNSKDLAFLSLFIMCIYGLVKYLQRKSLLRAAFHAFLCAFLIATRILGIIIFFFTVFFVVTDLLTAKEQGRGKALVSFLLYISLTVFFTILFWPILWIAPVSQFTTAFQQMSRFNFWSTVLYMGEYVKAKSLPWHYVPVWILVTTPVLYIVFFIVGLFALMKDLFTAPIRFYKARRDDLIWVLWFFIPIISIIALESVLYDGWRHLFFVYPAFLMIALVGVKLLFESIKKRSHGAAYKVASGLCTATILASLAGTAFLMVKYHPYQNVYFNFLTGDMKNAKDKFDMDYWGISHRQALEYILDNDTDRVIKVSSANPPGSVNFLVISPEDRSRLVYVEDPKESKYFMSEYRWHKEDYPYENEVFSIKVGNAKIMSVFKLK
jgi:hypothetical protein